MVESAVYSSVQFSSGMTLDARIEQTKNSRQQHVDINKANAAALVTVTQHVERSNVRQVQV